MKTKDGNSTKHRIVRPFELKKGSLKSDGTFEGYGAIFHEMDSYRDIIMPGAFAVSLREDFIAKDRLVPMLWQHNEREPIGVYREIYEDEKGLFVKGECNMEVARGRECHALMKQGSLTGLSIGYTTVVSEWNEQEIIRKLIQLNLWEVSPVTFPAGDNARTSLVKSITDMATLSDCETFLRDAGAMSHKEAKAFIAQVKSLSMQRDVAPVGDPSIKSALDILRSINH